MAGDEAVEHDVLVLQSLRFVDGEQERRGEVLARRGLVLIAHDQHGELRGVADPAVQLAFGRILVRQQRRVARFAAHGLDQEVALPVDGAETPMFDLEQGVGEARGLRPIAEVGGEHAQLLPFRELRIAPEKRFDLAPGEKVGMHDLVGVAAEHEAVRRLQRFQHQCELCRGEVLDFIHDHEVVARRGQRQPVMREQVQVVKPRFGEPRPVFLEQIVKPVAFLRGEDRLANAQRSVILA